MSATTLGAFIALAASYAAGMFVVVQYLGRRMDRLEDRLERIEGRLTAIEVKVAEIGQRLDDHIQNHPGPSSQLVRGGGAP